MTGVQQAAMVVAGFVGIGIGLVYGGPGARRWAVAIVLGFTFYLTAAIVAAPVLPVETAPSVIGR